MVTFKMTKKTENKENCANLLKNKLNHGQQYPSLEFIRYPTGQLVPEYPRVTDNSKRL